MRVELTEVDREPIDQDAGLYKAQYTQKLIVASTNHGNYEYVNDIKKPSDIN